jgi:uncharacterized membrane protein YgcG
MSLILSSSALAAMLLSWCLLKLGATSMLARYPFAVVLSYAVFLGGVSLWLRYVRSGASRPAGTAATLRDEGLLMPNLGGSSGGSGGGSGSGGGAASGDFSSGGGGNFGGGGAEGSWLVGFR